MLGSLVSFRYTDGRKRPREGYVVTVGAERVQDLLDAGAPIEVVSGRKLVGPKAEEPKKEEPKPEPPPDGEAPEEWPEGYTHTKHGAYVAVADPHGEPVLSTKPSGKFKGLDAAREAAWSHKGGTG